MTRRHLSQVWTFSQILLWQRYISLQQSDMLPNTQAQSVLCCCTWECGLEAVYIHSFQLSQRLTSGWWHVSYMWERLTFWDADLLIHITGAVIPKGTANLKQYFKNITDLNDVYNIAGSNAVSKGIWDKIDDGQKHSSRAGVQDLSVTHVTLPARLNWLLSDVVHRINRALLYRRGHRRFETRLWEENLIPG